MEIEAIPFEVGVFWGIHYPRESIGDSLVYIVRFKPRPTIDPGVNVLVGQCRKSL